MRSLIRTRNSRSASLALAALCLASIANAAVPGQARVQLERARQAYDLAHFDAALEGYSEAYRIDPRPAFLFNIAQCHRQLGNYERASFFYRRFLDLSPGRPANAATVEALLREVEARQAEELRQRKLQAEAALQSRSEADARTEALKARAEQEAAAPKLVPVPPPERPASATVADASLQPRVEPPSVLSRWWFWTGVGVVAAAAGTTAYLVSRPAGTTQEPIHVQ